MKETNITYYRDIIGIGTLYIYAVAFLYTLFYYNTFGINIIYYISLTEILLEMITLLMSHGEKTKKGQYDNHIIYNVITTDSKYSNIESSDAPILVGENRAAIFLYDKKEDRSIIINRQHIVESTFKSISNGKSNNATRWLSLPEYFTFIRF